MRFFLAFAILLCIGGGAWLWYGDEFYWPARGNPSLALHLVGASTRLLAGGLFAMAVLGFMAISQARRGSVSSTPWQYAYFAIAMLAVALIAGAVWTSEIVPNPESGAVRNR